MAKTLYKHLDDDILIEEVRTVITKCKDELSTIDQNFHDNVIDPFSAIFESVSQNITYEAWLKSEKKRQIQKTLQSAIGYFHQNILGHFEGWRNPGDGAGYDSENVEKKIFAEIKNKYNTVNSDSERQIYTKLCNFLDTEKAGYTGYFVVIIPSSPKRYSKPFAPSKCAKREDLRKIDGASYYELCTGDKNALKLLFESLPKVISKIDQSNTFTKGSHDKDFLNLFKLAYGE